MFIRKKDNAINNDYMLLIKNDIKDLFLLSIICFPKSW